MGFLTRGPVRDGIREWEAENPESVVATPGMRQTLDNIYNDDRLADAIIDGNNVSIRDQEGSAARVDSSMTEFHEMAKNNGDQGFNDFNKAYEQNPKAVSRELEQAIESGNFSRLEDKYFNRDPVSSVDQDLVADNPATPDPSAVDGSDADDTVAVIAASEGPAGGASGIGGSDMLSGIEGALAGLLEMLQELFNELFHGDGAPAPGSPPAVAAAGALEATQAAAAAVSGRGEAAVVNDGQTIAGVADAVDTFVGVAGVMSGPISAVASAAADAVDQLQSYLPEVSDAAVADNNLGAGIRTAQTVVDNTPGFTPDV